MKIDRAFGSSTDRDRRGIALIMVMLIVSTLMIIGILFSGSVTAEYRAAVYYRQAVQSEQYCLVGMHRAMADLVYNVWGVNEDRPFVSARYNPAATGPDDNLLALGANEPDDFKKSAYYETESGSLVPITRQRGYWSGESWVVWGGTRFPGMFAGAGDPEVDGNVWNMDGRQITHQEKLGGAQRYISAGQGTVSCTNGSKVVTGAGTNFNTAMNGVWMTINGVAYQISTVGGAGSLTLAIATGYNNGKGAGVVTSGMGYFVAGSGSIAQSADGTLPAGTNALASHVAGGKGFPANPRWVNPEAFISYNASMGSSFQYGGVDLTGDGVVDDKDKALRDWALWELKRDMFLPRAMSNHDLFEPSLHANNRGRWGNKTGSKDNAYEFISPLIVGDSFYTIFRSDPIYTMYNGISGEPAGAANLAQKSDDPGYRYPYNRTHLGKDSAVALADDPVGGLVNINQVNNNYNIEEWTSTPWGGATPSQLIWYHINEAKWIYCFDPLNADRRYGRYAVTLVPDGSTWNAAALHAGCLNVYSSEGSSSAPFTANTGTVRAATGMLGAIRAGFNPQTGDNSGAALLVSTATCYAPIRPNPLPNNWSNDGTDGGATYFCLEGAPDTNGVYSSAVQCDHTRAPEIAGGHGGSAWSATGVRAAIFEYLCLLGPYNSRSELATHLRKAGLCIPSPAYDGYPNNTGKVPALRRNMEVEMNIQPTDLDTIARDAQMVAALTTVHGYYYTLDRFWDRDLLFVDWDAGDTASRTDTRFSNAQSSATTPISLAALEAAKDLPASADFRPGQNTRRMFLSDLNNLQCFGGYRTRDGSYRLLDYLFNGDIASGQPGVDYQVSAVYGGAGTPVGDPPTWLNQKRTSRREKFLATNVSRVASQQRAGGVTASCANGHLLHSPQINAVFLEPSAGTMTCAVNATAVTGTGTNFQASWVGSNLYAAGFWYLIMAVAGPTGMTITRDLTGKTMLGSQWGFTASSYRVTRNQASQVVLDEIGAGCPVCGAKLFLAPVYEMNINEVGRFYGKFRNAERPTRLAYDLTNSSQRPMRHFVELLVSGRGNDFGATDQLVRFDNLYTDGAGQLYDFPAVLADPITRKPYFSYDLEFDQRIRMTSDASDPAYTEGRDPEPFFRFLIPKGGGDTDGHNLHLLVYDDNDNGGRGHDVTWGLDGAYGVWTHSHGTPVLAWSLGDPAALYGRVTYIDDLDPDPANWVTTPLRCDEYYAMADPDPAHRQANANAYINTYRKTPVRWAGGERVDTWDLHYNVMAQYSEGPLPGWAAGAVRPTEKRGMRGVGCGRGMNLSLYRHHDYHAGHDYLYFGDGTWPGAVNNKGFSYSQNTETPGFKYKDPEQFGVVSFDSKFDGSRVALVWGYGAGSMPAYDSYRVASYVELTDSVGNPQRISNTCTAEGNTLLSWQVRNSKDHRGNLDGYMGWDLLPMTLNGEINGTSNAPTSNMIGYDPWWVSNYGANSNWWGNGNTGFTTRAAAQQMPAGYWDLGGNLTCNNRNSNQWNRNVPVRRATFDGTSLTARESAEGIYEALYATMHDHCNWYGTMRNPYGKENIVSIPTGINRQLSDIEATTDPAGPGATYGGRQYSLGGTWHEGNATVDPKYKWAAYSWSSWDKILNVTDLCQSVLWKIYAGGYKTAEDVDMYDANQDGQRDEQSSSTLAYFWSDSGATKQVTSVRGSFIGELRQINKLNLNELWYPPTFGGVSWNNMWYGSESSYTSFGRKPLKGFHAPSDALTRHFYVWNADPGYNMRVQPWDLDGDFSINSSSDPGYNRFDSTHCGAGTVYTIYVTGNVLDEIGEPLAEMRLRVTVERTWDGRCNVLEFCWLPTDRGFLG